MKQKGKLNEKTRRQKKRWKQSCNIEGIIFVILGFLLLTNTGSAGILPSIFMFIMALFAFRDANKGWKISYDLPPSYYKDIAAGGKRAKEANEIAEKVLKESKDPDRIKYAFDPRLKNFDEE